MTGKLLGKIILFASCLTLLWSVPSFGQVLKGSISGTAVDQQGAVVSGAQVKATNTETANVLTTTTDNSGTFHFNLIPAGNYKVEISAQNFKTSVQNNILVSAGRDSGLGPIKLTVGEASTTVEVTADTPLIETTQAQVTNTFSGTALTNFAGIQENQGLDNLALFVPGVVSSRDNNFSNTNGGGGFSVNGLRGRNNDQEIDGQNNNDNTLGGPSLFLSDPEFVSQYVIITNNFGPEYGRNAGSVVNLITKSGTNDWHGSIYENENNRYLNSMTSTQKANGLTDPPRSNDEFGGFTIGGPLVKNRAFLFGGFDQEILTASTLYSTGLVTPTPTGLATLATCFPTGPAANAVSAMSRFGPYGVTAGNPTPGNIVDSGLASNGDPLAIAGCDHVQLGTVSRVLPTPFHGFNLVTKEDITLGGNDSLSARYIFNRGNNFNADDNGAAGYVINIPALSQALLLSETHNFSSRMVNELRVGFDRLNLEFGGSSIGNEPTAGQIFSPNVLSQIIIQDGASLGFGVNAGLPQGRVVNTWQVQDNWNYVLGKHALKAGVNWTRQQSPSIFLPFVNGAYVFNSLSDYFNNNPLVDIIEQGNPELGLKEYDTFFYVGDDWKIGRNLTLNLGVTYSYFGAPYNQLHDLGVAQQTGPNPFWDTTLPLSITTPPTVASFKKGIGPSFGFAYSPQWGGFLTGNGKTTIRGGYRLSYDPTFYNIISNNYGSAPSTLQAVLPGTAIGGDPATQMPAVPTGPNVRAALVPLISSLGPLDPRTLGESFVSPNFRPDQVQGWSLGIERELTKNSAFEVRYVGNHASQLFNSVNGNPFVADLAAQFPNLVPAGVTPCPLSQAFDGAAGPNGSTAFGRVNCNQGVTSFRNNSGYSNYQGVQTEFRANNLFHQMTLRAGYTFSKTLDNVSEIFSTGGAGSTTSLAQNPFNISGAEYSLSGLDIPHTFSLEVVEQVPFFKEQHGLMGHVLGGWALSGSYVWESGQPFTPVDSSFAGPIANGGNSTANGDFFDNNFLNQFGSATARPFLGNKSAPVDSVGLFQGDACRIFVGVDPNSGAILNPSAPLCAGGLTSQTLISLNNINQARNPQNPNAPGFDSATYQPVAVTNQQVRYIANTGIAETVFGTPFGNAARNIGRDAPLNFLNASVTKRIKFNERASFELRFTALNALNHANFATVDPNIENAGNGLFGNTFALPQFTGDSIPGSNLAASRRFYFGGTFRF